MNFDFSNERHGTVSLLAGIDLLTGKVHALVKDRIAAAFMRWHEPDE